MFSDLSLISLLLSWYVTTHKVLPAQCLSRVHCKVSLCLTPTTTSASQRFWMKICSYINSNQPCQTLSSLWCLFSSSSDVLPEDKTLGIFRLASFWHLFQPVNFLQDTLAKWLRSHMMGQAPKIIPTLNIISLAALRYSDSVLSYTVYLSMKD